MKYKQIQVTEDEWKHYKKLAGGLSKELGVHVYINGFVKKAVQYYEENHKPVAK